MEKKNIFTFYFSTYQSQNFQNVYLLSPLPGWARPENKAAKGGDAVRPPSIVGGGQLTPVESIKKMLLHVHSVAPLQTAANNGMNSPAAARRLSLPPPGKVMRHFLTNKHTDKQTNKQTDTALIHSSHCGYNGRQAAPWKHRRSRCRLVSMLNFYIWETRLGGASGECGGGWGERGSWPGVCKEAARNQSAVFGSEHFPTSSRWLKWLWRGQLTFQHHSRQTDSLGPVWADGSCPLRRTSDDVQRRLALAGSLGLSGLLGSRRNSIE